METASAPERHLLSGQPVLGPWVKRNSLGVAMGLLAMVAAMLFVFFEPFVVTGHHVWLLNGPGDMWTQWRAAGLLPSGGGYAQIFSYDSLLKTPPGWELLISPIAHRFLSWPFPYVPSGYTISQPKVLWIAGPTELLAVPFAMCAVDVWLRRLGASFWRRMAVLAALVVVLPPASFWGHPEDVMALSCAMLSLRAIRDDRWSAGWWMGAALAFQIEAILVLPLLLVVLARRRIAFLVKAAVVPLAVTAVPLIRDFHDTVHALLHQTIFPGNDRFTPFHKLNANSATVDDLLTLLVALVIAGWVWRRRNRFDDASLFWLLGVVYSLRLFYPSLFPYYIIPALTVFCAASVVRRPLRFASTLLLGVAMTWWVQSAPVDGNVLFWLSICYPMAVMALLSYPGHHAPEPAPPPIEASTVQWMLDPSNVGAT